METLLLQYGYLMLFLASFLEWQVSTLICWFLIFTGHFNLWIAFAIIIFADIANDSLYYRLGRKLFKLPRVAAFIDKSHFLSSNLDVIKNSDYIIDLGPDGGDKGGDIIAEGTPEDIITSERSFTGKYLRRMLRKW